MKYEVLVVDDSSTSRKVLVKALKMTGLEVSAVHQAEDGAQAYEILKKERIDLVLSDLNMPRVSGAELVKKMAEEGRLRKIPVILVTSDRNRDRLAGLMELGASSWLNKPFRPEDLRMVMERALAAPGRNRG